MFQEIWEQKGLRIEIERAEELESAYLHKITRQIPEGVCKAWVIKNDGEIIASGAITIVSFVPVPSDLSHTKTGELKGSSIKKNESPDETFFP